MFSTNNKVCQDELSRSCGIDTLLVQQLVLKLISFAGDHMTVGEAALHLQESVTEITIHENDIMRLTMLGCKLLATNAYEYGLLLTTAAAMREE
jgi:two-component sensor histidine kinase